MNSLHTEAMYGHWKHSFEEDGPEEMVYRPESFGFQRSRGRKEIQITADGKFIDTGPGPSDVPESFRGNWRIENGFIFITYDDGHAEQYTIKEVTPEKLVLKRT
jgi:hypothetical protein